MKEPPLSLSAKMKGSNEGRKLVSSIFLIKLPWLLRAPPFASVLPLSPGNLSLLVFSLPFHEILRRRNDTLSRMKIATNTYNAISSVLSSFKGKNDYFKRFRQFSASAETDSSRMHAGRTKQFATSSNVPGAGCRRDRGRLPLLGFHPTTRLR